MYLLAIAWAYVVVLMALAEGTSANGSWLGATITFVFYGVVPLGIVLYLFATPARRAARRRAAQSAALDPHGGGHPPGDAVTPVREEP